MVITGSGSKRGAAHFEMIMSFILFAGFVTFLFLFLSPYETKSIQKNLLDDVYNAFTEQASTNLTTLFLKTDFDRSGCFYVEIPSEILKYGMSESIVYSATTGEKRKSTTSGNQISIEGTDKFFNIFISPIFSSDSLNGCGKENQFTLGSVVNQQVLAYPKMMELANEYETDYPTLKEKLTTPPNYDFAIISSDIGLSMQGEIPKDVEVLSRSYVGNILYDNATMINVEFIVKTW